MIIQYNLIFFQVSLLPLTLFCIQIGFTKSWQLILTNIILIMIQIGLYILDNWKWQKKYSEPFSYLNLMILRAQFMIFLFVMKDIMQCDQGFIIAYQIQEYSKIVMSNKKIQTIRKLKRLCEIGNLGFDILMSIVLLFYLFFQLPKDQILIYIIGLIVNIITLAKQFYHVFIFMKEENIIEEPRSSQTQLFTFEKNQYDQIEFPICSIQFFGKQNAFKAIQQNQKFQEEYNKFNSIEKYFNRFFPIDEQQNLYQCLKEMMTKPYEIKEEKKNNKRLLTEYLNQIPEGQSKYITLPKKTPPAVQFYLEIPIQNSIINMVGNFYLTIYQQSHQSQDNLLENRINHRTFICQISDQQKQDEHFYLVNAKMMENDQIIITIQQFTLPERHFQSKYLIFIISQAEKCQKIYSWVNNMVKKNKNESHKKKLNRIVGSLMMMVNLNFVFMDLLGKMPEGNKCNFDFMKMITENVNLIKQDLIHKKNFDIKVYCPQEGGKINNNQKQTRQIILNIIDIFKHLIINQQSDIKKKKQELKLDVEENESSYVLTFESEKCVLNQTYVQNLKNLMNHSVSSKVQNELLMLQLLHLLRFYDQIGNKIQIIIADKGLIIKLWVLKNYTWEECQEKSAILIERGIDLKSHEEKQTNLNITKL